MTDVVHKIQKGDINTNNMLKIYKNMIYYIQPH